MWNDADGSRGIGCCSPTAAGMRQQFAAVGAAANCAVLKNRKNTHAPASPAAEAISGKGRARRRSVKNRRPFDCFKSAVRHPIQRSRCGRPRNRFTAAHFGSTFWVTKGGTIIKVFVVKIAAGGQSRAEFIFGGCGGAHQRCEPPKITPRSGVVVRAAISNPRAEKTFPSFSRNREKKVIFTSHSGVGDIRTTACGRCAAHMHAA